MKHMFATRSGTGRRWVRVALVAGAVGMAVPLGLVVPAAHAASSVTAVSFAASPTIANANPATWTIKFTTSSAGAMTAGSSVIAMAGPALMRFPLSAVSYKVNSNVVTVPPTQTAPNNVTIVSPVSPPNNHDMIIQVTGVTNPPMAGYYPGSQFAVATSSDTAPAHPANGIAFSTSYGPQQILPFTSSPDAPQGVATDKFGDVFQANIAGNKVLELPVSGGAYGPQADLTPDFLPSLHGGAVFNPVALATDGNGDLFVSDFESDTGNGQVLELVRSGSSFMSPAVNLTSKFTAPHFAPVGVATDGLGNLYVGDAETVPSGSGSGMVFESPLSGGVFQPAAVLPFGGAHFDPLGLAVDKAGNVYAADGEGGAFFGYTGHVLMLPNNGSSFGSQVALPFGGTHFFPYGVAVDGLNNVYASDLETQNGDGRVLEILATTAGHYAPQIALPYGGADFNPFQVAVNGQGEPFVGDLENGTAGRVLALPVNTASFISSGANPAGVGELTAFATTVLPTSGLGNPTGTVAMSDTDGVLSCPSAALTPVGGGKPGSVASCTMSSPYTDSQRTNPATNPDTVSASYSGDLHYVPSTARYAEGIAQCIVGNRGSQVVVAAPACVGDPTNSVPTTLLAGLKTTGSGAAVNIQRIVDTGAITASNLVSSSGGNQVPSGYSFIMCNSQVNGPVSVSKAAGKVLIGDPNACGSNSLVGGLTLSNNTGGVTVGGNSLIFGGFSCSSNAPAPTNDGQKNNAFPGGSGQCAGL